MISNALPGVVYAQTAIPRRDDLDFLQDWRDLSQKEGERHVYPERGDLSGQQE